MFMRKNREMKWEKFLQLFHSVNRLLIKGSRNCSGLWVKVRKLTMQHRLRNESVHWGWTWRQASFNIWKFLKRFHNVSGLLIKGAESHFGQNDTLARDTLARTVWPDWQFGQSDLLARDSLAGETVWPVTLWPEWHFGQSDTLARETLWPEWHFGQRHFGQRSKALEYKVGPNASP